MNQKFIKSRCGVVFYPMVFPNEQIDLYKWSVVACDQYTADLDYWEDVANITAETPSTLHCIYPEAYLHQDPQQRIKAISAAMRHYLDNGIVRDLPAGCMFINRKTALDNNRYGIIAAIDLDEYDYTPGSKALVRATEKTIIERIPPRVAIRKDACLEFPHVLVLYNDPEQRLNNHFINLIENGDLSITYQTDLMKNGGSISGYFAENNDDLQDVADIFDSLLPADPDEIMFAVGDGNHSLATAKHIWEELKKDPQISRDHPARYALVEFINLHDAGLGWEPIHRVLFNTNTQSVLDYLNSCPGLSLEKIDNAEIESFRNAGSDVQECICITKDAAWKIRFNTMHSVLVIGELQSLLDQAGFEGELDYIHGFDETLNFGRKDQAVSFLLPGIDPQLLFKCVENEGVLPRKTFSLGHADEKRYYMEGKRIR